jgi:hypothetical protein
MSIKILEKMDKKEFLERHDKIRTRVTDKYGSFLYFLVADVINIGNIEIVCEKIGYKVVRQTNIMFITSDLYFNEQKIGVISSSAGFPKIEFFKRKKTHAKIIAKNDLFIKPIKGIHRFLEWHKLEGKLHILAAGQIVLHATPDILPDEKCADFFKKFDDEMRIKKPRKLI